jgi:HAD superfamily hydrolase (TIGR01509 family)
LALKKRERPAKFQIMAGSFLRGVEAIFFDFEGTLVDFQWNLRGAVRETLEMLSALGFPMDRLQGKKYSLLMTEAARLAPEIGQSPNRIRELIGTIYNRYDEDALSRWVLRSGAIELLTAVRAKGLLTALISNVGRETLEKALLKLDLNSLFQILVSRNDVSALKPSGEGIRLALNRLKAPEERTLFVGDSVDDIQAAREAGTRVIILLGGENLRETLLSEKPDATIYHLKELLL